MHFCVYICVLNECYNVIMLVQDQVSKLLSSFYCLFVALPLRCNCLYGVYRSAERSDSLMAPALMKLTGWIPSVSQWRNDF